MATSILVTDTTQVERAKPVASKPTLARELVSFLAPVSEQAEQYRTLRHAIERLHAEAGHRVFGLTSAGVGEGKSLTTLNLAGALSQSPNARILVVSGDLHRLGLEEYLGVTRLKWNGLSDALASPDTTLAQVTRRIDSLNLSVVVSGNARTRPYELLASPRFQALMAEARESFDYVLVDTPPILALADARLVGRCIDGFIVVVAAGKTRRADLAEAMSLMDPAKVVGVVLNGDDRPSPCREYYHR
jgi:capsular exopolysaccharide synthesis family protein